MMRYWFGRCVPAIMAAGVAVLLGGCASRPAAQTADDPVCRREAYNDPQVKALFNQPSPSNGWATASVAGNYFNFGLSTPREDAQYAYRQAVLTCMQRRGLMTSGGVEPVRQYPFGPLGY